MKLTFPRYMYSSKGEAVLVAEDKDADGLFVKPSHKWSKDEKAFKYEAPKEVKK